MPDIYISDTDYLKTLERMYKDSRILYNAEEYYNCCYLCGYVLECALKYILLKFGKNEEGNVFTIRDMKKAFRHNIRKLNSRLDECISLDENIPSRYRIDAQRHTPCILKGKGGYKAWDPELRYGEHPMWNDKEYCEYYMRESEYVFNFIAEIVV